jgi:hypothetical protein
VQITRIDNDNPIGTISYTPSTATSGTVQASISFNKPGVIVSNNSSNTDYLFTGNGNFTFTFIDEAGNTGNETAFVDRIDQEAPIATIVSYSPSTPTNQNVTVTVSLSEEIQYPL